MSARLAALSLVAVTACTTPSETPPLARKGPVSGDIRTTAGGDAWLFLYRPGEGPPGAPATPLDATAVGARRLAEDPRFVFPLVEPNTYRAFGLIDVDGDFDPSFDVLAQPSKGDRVGWTNPFAVQPGRGAIVSVEIDEPVFANPPAFSIEGEPDFDVVLDPALDAITPVTLVADAAGHYDSREVAFTLGLVDADGDQRPDDVDGDGVPDLSLRFFLRWLPLPGQLRGDSTVIVPLLFDPSSFLRTLEGRLGASVSVLRLQVVMVPQAQSLTPEADGGTAIAAFGPPPAGAYELVVLAAGGQFWKLPNAWGAQVPSQGTTLHIDRVTR